MEKGVGAWNRHVRWWCAYTISPSCRAILRMFHLPSLQWEFSYGSTMASPISSFLGAIGQKTGLPSTLLREKGTSRTEHVIYACTTASFGMKTLGAALSKQTI